MDNYVFEAGTPFGLQKELLLLFNKQVLITFLWCRNLTLILVIKLCLYISHRGDTQQSQFNSNLDRFFLLSYVYSLNNMCMCSFYVLQHSSLERVGRELYVLYVKLIKLILSIGCLSQHLTPQRISFLLQSPKCKYLKPWLVESSVNVQHAHRQNLTNNYESTLIIC